MKWYEKTWEWIKKYWGVVLSAFTLAIGYIIGRKQSVSGLDGLVRQLRSEVELLGAEVEQLRAYNIRHRCRRGVEQNSLLRVPLCVGSFKLGVEYE